jgi:hypothetical protein
VPVRRSQFVAAGRRFRAFNVEVAQDRINSFSFTPDRANNVLYYDLQTQLHNSYAGRHGSGRSGFYRGRYLKGVGRTPAAANWNNERDLYHGSGHLSVASAIRERLITVFLQARGLGDAIVPCESVLIKQLSAAQKRTVQRAKSSSCPRFAPCDGHMIALTVKPADFARISNFVFALDHTGTAPEQIGQLFLDLEYYLRPESERIAIEGAPETIARCLDLAFCRALEKFEAFGRIGLNWLFLDSNFTLDGRFFDLETPMFFGAPFIGISVGAADGVRLRQLVGFEEFGLVLHWRLFIAWLQARLRLLCAREISNSRATRPFLVELQRRIADRFSDRHLLYRDAELAQRASANLANALALNRRDRFRLTKIARAFFAWRVYETPPKLPNVSWQTLKSPPAPVTPFPRQFKRASFLQTSPSADAERFATAIEQLSSTRSLTELLGLLERAEQFIR